MLYNRYIALFLLFLFVRVLLPESIVLSLHQHTHTTEKRLDKKSGTKQLDVKHIHCQTDHLFHNTYYTLPAVVTVPVACVQVAARHSLSFTVWKFTFPHNICLRGPPPASFTTA